MAALAVDRRREEDDEELFRLYRDVFGHEMTEASRRRWAWQYRENPHAGGAPEIWVARQDGRILGQYASMPVGLWWGGREVRASWGMDVFLREEARGQGVGALLFDTWSGSVDVALGMGLTTSSYGLFQKLHYRDVGPVPFYRKVLDPVAVLGRRVGRVAAALAGPVLGAALRSLNPEAPGGTAGVQVRPATGFGPEYDRLWERARDSYAMCVRRDAAYLEWKYERCPRGYARWEARRGEELVGFAVSRHEDHRGLRLGWIVDVFTGAADHPARSALLAAVLADFRRARVARAQAFSLNAGLGAELLRHGFSRGPSPMQFCVRANPRERGGSGGAGEPPQLSSAREFISRARDDHDVLADPGRWHVTFGDSDMDR
jgi:GNAT superfamily N-acetyltransferase